MFLNKPIKLVAMIKTIIFDLGNVIVNFDEAPIFRKWAAASNKSVPQIREYYKNSSARKKFEKGEITPKQFYRKTKEELGMKISLNDFKKAWNGIFALNSDVEKLIRKLKGRYKLVLLSNTNVWQYEYIKRKYGIVNIFDEYVLSYKIGCRKPNPMIFMKAIKKSGTLPWNCAYFDDIAGFVHAARLMGIMAFQYKNTEKLKNDLISLKAI